MEVIRNFINGKWTSPQNAVKASLKNPGNFEDVIGTIEYADEKTAESAMDAAESSKILWKNTPLLKRIELLENCLSLIEVNRESIARTITRENGKTLSESNAEISSSISEGRYQLKFFKVEEERSKDNVRYEPLGPVLLITPSNFPLATIIRKLIPALAAGNTAVVKPSEVTPLTAVRFFGMMHEAGLPGGVVNLVIGEGSVIGPALLNRPALKAVSLTGSTLTGRSVSSQIAGRDIRLQAEMGGKNAVVVLKDADLELALDAVSTAGFACCGQWCTGTSRVIVELPVYNEFITRLAERIKNIKVGLGTDPDSQMGPLVSEAQFKKVVDAVESAKKEGARLICGGRKPKGTPEGYYFEPTMFADVSPNMQIAREEIFGPVLAVIPAEDTGDAIRITNSSKYGLSASVYTEDEDAAEKIIDAIDAGLCHINLPTSFRDPSLPLLGWKDSGAGIPESGRFARDFFTKTKAIYRRKV